MDKHNRQARKATRLVVTLDNLFPESTTGELADKVRVMFESDPWWAALVVIGTDNKLPSLETRRLVERILHARF
jgi:hypothetical protein